MATGHMTSSQVCPRYEPNLVSLSILRIKQVFRASQFVKLLFLTLGFAVVGCEGNKPVEQKPKQEKAQEVSAKIDVVFDDLTSKLGIAHTYLNGEESNEMSILQTIGGGVAAFDYDRDGWDDLFFPGGGALKNKTISGLFGSLWQSPSVKNLSDVTLLSGTAIVLSLIPT